MLDNNELALELKKIIDCETISEIGVSNSEKFEKCYEVMRELFPNFFGAVSVANADGNLLMKWKGNDSSLEPILLMNHYDVVSAEGEWKHPPFQAEIENERLYGRGTLDTKGGLYCMLKAAEELIKEGYVPSRDIYFESACTEETGGEGSDAISKALKTKGLHFSMVIDEGGMMVKDPIGGSDVICAAIGVGEKRAVDIKFTAKSHGGHASTPSKNTPLVRLGKFMAEIDTKNVFKSHLSDTLVEAFKIVSPYATGIKKFLFENASKLKPIVEFIVPRVSSTANALFKTTIAFTRAQGSEGNNVLPEEAYVIGNMRCTHYQGLKSSLKAVEKIANKYDISMEVISPGIKSSVSSHETPEYELVKNTINKLFPDVLVLPYIQNGASDSRFFSRVCDNVFRFVPFKVDNEQLSSVHGLNENLNIKDLAPAVEFYKEIIKGT